MGLMDPIFRDINYRRIERLKKRDLSDGTVACILNDENPDKTEEEVTAADVKGFLKMSRRASRRMLISQQTMDAIEGDNERGEALPST